MRATQPSVDELLLETPAAEVEALMAIVREEMEGAIELLQYYRQQSICNNYHRYGNLGERGLTA